MYPRKEEEIEMTTNNESNKHVTMRQNVTLLGLEEEVTKVAAVKNCSRVAMNLQQSPSEVDPIG